MKLRHPLAIKLASWAGTQILRALGGTTRYHCQYIGENTLPEAIDRRVIYVFWHEYMLAPAYRFARPDIHVLSSPHADGQFMAGMLQRLGFRSIMGSSGRDSLKAMRALLKISRESHIAITPDGPRGPRRKVKPGIIHLAARTGLPIVPFGFAFSRCRRMGSWDQLAIPKMFGQCFGVTATPIEIPRNISGAAIEPFRLEVEEKMHALTEIAERWAETGQYDSYDYDALVRFPTWENRPLKGSLRSLSTDSTSLADLHQ